MDWSDRGQGCWVLEGVKGLTARYYISHHVKMRFGKNLGFIYYIIYRNYSSIVLSKSNLFNGNTGLLSVEVRP